MREKIWYELCESKHAEIYLAKLISRQKTNKKRFKITTLSFSSVGILGWSIWEIGILPVIACFLVSVVQLLNLNEGHLILNDTDIEKIAELRNKYLKYLYKIEKLWIDLELETMNEIEASEAFYLHKGLQSEFEALDNQLEIKLIKSIKKKAEEETLKYLKQCYNIEIGEK